MHINEVIGFPIDCRVKILSTGETGVVTGYPNFILRDSDPPLVAVYTDFIESEIKQLKVVSVTDLEHLEDTLEVLDFAEIKELSDKDKKFLKSLNSNQRAHLYKMFVEVSDICWKNGFKEGKN